MPTPEPVPPAAEAHRESRERSSERSGLRLGGPPAELRLPPTPTSPAPRAGPSLREQIAGLGSGLTADTGGAARRTVPLDSREPRFLDYLARLKRHIQSEWIYPEDAQRLGMAGELALVFTLNKTGTLTYIRLVESSGFPVLDEEALRAVKAAAPFEPFPPQMGDEPWNISAVFRYYSPYSYRRN